MEQSVWIQLSGIEPKDVMRLLGCDQGQVIAACGRCAAPSSSAPHMEQETYMEQAERCEPMCHGECAADDLVPLEELWPPLDEPEDEGPPCPAGDDGTRDIASPQAGDKERPADLRTVAAQAALRSAVGAAGPTGHRAPLITVVSGRGGVGKTTLVAAMAACAARAGLRAAVLDLDLMFGDLPAVLGVDTFRGLEAVTAHARGGKLAEEDIEAAAMRVGPGLTLWGPLEAGECAELHGSTVEQLIDVLRGAADVIFADTSVFWGDAVAVAVAACDRCLVVGSGGEAAGTAASHVVGLAGRLGVPVARMTSVFNRMGERGAGEEEALRFEMTTSLHSRLRVASGGEEVTGMSSFGKLDALVSGNGEFAKSIRSCTAEILRELGCNIDARLSSLAAHAGEERQTFRLPWRRRVRTVQ